MSTKINYSKNTVGCTVGGEIFIHPELYKYSELYKAIINHEKKHSSGMELRDVKLDLFNDDLKDVKKEYYKFILIHPRTLLGFLPLTKVGKNWAFDLQLFVLWAIGLSLGYWVGVSL